MSEALPVLETRDHEAMAIVHRNMLWSGGAGVLPFPLFDLAAITAVQIKLVKELADFYGIPFRRDIAKSIVISLLGTLTSGTLAALGIIASLKWVPVVGHLLAFLSLPAAAVGVTYAVGKVFVQHFEAGGTLLDFDPAEVKEYFRQQFEEGRREAEEKAAAEKSSSKKTT